MNLIKYDEIMNLNTPLTPFYAIIIGNFVKIIKYTFVGLSGSRLFFCSNKFEKFLVSTKVTDLRDFWYLNKHYYQET